VRGIGGPFNARELPWKEREIETRVDWVTGVGGFRA